MKQVLHWLGWGCCFALLAGCVERRMTVVSNPPGAMVTVNGQEIGAAPVDVPSHLFIYHGDYDIKLVRDGYEPLLVKQAVPPPWYERVPFDFFAENVVPWHIKDKHVFAYELLPNQVVPTEDLLRNANIQRSRGQMIGPPPEMPPPTAVQPEPTFTPPQ